MKLVNADIGTKVQVKKCSDYTKLIGRQGTIMGTSRLGNVLVDFGDKRIDGMTLHGGNSNLKIGTNHNTDTCWYLFPKDLKIVKE